MYIIDEDNVCKQSQEEREIHIQTFVYEVYILYRKYISYSCSPESTRVIKLIILTSGEWMYTKNAQQYTSL